MKTKDKKSIFILSILALVLICSFLFIGVNSINFKYALYRRIPKRGFNNARFRTEYATINLADLNKFFKDGDVVTPELLKEAGLVKKELNGIKVLGNGKLEKKLTVKANLFTNSAITKIEELGGTTEVI